MVIVDPIIVVIAIVLVIHESVVILTVVVSVMDWGLTVDVGVISIVILEPRLCVTIVLLILTRVHCAESVSL